MRSSARKTTDDFPRRTSPSTPQPVRRGFPSKGAKHVKPEMIDDRARVWVVMRGPDLRLKAEIDPDLLAKLNPDHTADEIAEALVQAAGEMDVAETRAW